MNSAPTNWDLHVTFDLATAIDDTGNEKGHLKKPLAVQWNKRVWLNLI